MAIIYSIYLNFFSVCSLIPATFMLSLAITFVMIKNKSRATLHLGIAYSYMTIFFVGYFVAAAFYHPLAAYHRWLTVGSVLLVETHFILFILNFPDIRFTRLSKVVGVILYIVSLALSGAFFSLSLESEKVFNFMGHYWDFKADYFSMIFGIVIIAYLVIFLIAGIIRTIITKSRQRFSILAISLIMFFSISVPAVLNILSRDGMIDRGTFQVVHDLLTVVGFFLVTVIYINSTDDRTNFMTKILGISFTTLLIIFQGLSYYSLQDLEQAYDRIHQKDLQLIIKTKDRPDDLRYLLTYSFNTGRFQLTGGTYADFSMANLSAMKSEYDNTYSYENILAAPANNWKGYIIGNVTQSHEDFKAYGDAIVNFLNELPDGKEDNPQNLHAYMRRLDMAGFYFRNKINQIPDKDFRALLKKYLSRERPIISPLQNTISTLLDSISADGAELKNKILQYLAPLKPAGVRLYRASPSGGQYTSYIIVDFKSNSVVEAGFSYVEYRQFLHPTSMKFIIMLGVLLVFIFIGFQFFYRGAFISPLKTLLSGMHDVSDGNLEVEIPVTVQDELGFISKNFNNMVLALRLAKGKLDEYATDLEKKVEERTVDLKKANDELNAYMALMEQINEDLTNAVGQLKEAQEIAARDMKMAAFVQSNLYLTEAPQTNEWDVAYEFRPMSGVSGDLYDFFYDGNRLLGISLFDVSGHGIASGLVTMLAKSIIFRRFSTMKGDKLGSVLSFINSDLIEEIGDVDNYLTGILLRFRGRIIEYVNAGHRAPLYYSSKAGKVKTVESREHSTQGMFLGIKMMTDTYQTINFEMSRDDCLFLFTDGLEESKNSEGEEYGIMRIAESLKNARGTNSKEILRSILTDFQDFVSTDELSDDLTAILIKRKN